MQTVAQIEEAILKLPTEQLDELTEWFTNYRREKTYVAELESWLTKSRGVAQQGVTTESIMKLSRGDD